MKQGMRLWAMAGAVLLLPLLACGERKAQAKTPVPTTQTNEQGCTRQRSIGPQDPFQNPPPLKQACVGPYLLEMPQHLFYSQMGAEFDGSFGLVLQYPGLQPFAPGERMNLKLDVSMRTVAFDYWYIDRIELRQAMRNAYIPIWGDPADPSRTLEGRIAGEPVYGLLPYYADLPSIRAYKARQGIRADARVMDADRHQDWFITRDAAGEVDRLIRCTSREVGGTGVVFRDGLMYRDRGTPYSECTHQFMLPEHSTLVRITYVRLGLKDWQQIEDKARALFFDHLVSPVQRPS